MNHWIKRIHMYAGLLNLTVLTIFGIIGIVASFPEGDGPKPELSEWFIEFDVPGGLDDRQLADHIHTEIALPFTRPAPDWRLGRDKSNNLSFGLPAPGFVYDVTALEGEDRLRIRQQPYKFQRYLFHLHEMTPSEQPYLEMRLWSYYMEFSIWALIVMALTGLYVWLASGRRNLKWAQASFVAGVVVFAVFYTVVR